MEDNIKSPKIAVIVPVEEIGLQPESKWTKKKICTLIGVALGNLFSGTCYGLMAPIFPAEAERKGASVTLYSLVFSIYQVAMLISSPIYGIFMPKLTPAYMMKIGMFTSGCCVMLFGLLQYVEGGWVFIILALVIRLIDGLGASAFLTASYTTLGCELPDMMGRAMSITEAGFAFGLAAGPAIGGYLFEVGGFFLPFVVIGATLWLAVILNTFLFGNDKKDIPPHTMKLWEMLSDVDFVIDIISITTCFAVIGFNEASLEPHIRQFGLKPSYTGAIFLMSGITDALFSPVFGYISEKLSNAQYVTIIGTIFFTVCFAIVGPISILKFETNLDAVIVAQFLLGLGMAAVIVSSFTHGMKHFIQKGYPDEVGTYSMTSSVIFSAACFGAVIGPLIGGLLIDYFAYIRSTEVVVGVNILVVIICSLRIVYTHIAVTLRKVQHVQGM